MKELQKVFQDLHGVARRALADLIAAAPERESVFLREILAHAADPDEVLPACVERGGVAPALVVLDQTAAGEGADGFVGLGNGDLLLCPHRDGDGVRAHNGNAHAGAGNTQPGEMQDLAPLVLHFHFFVGIEIIEHAAEKATYFHNALMDTFGAHKNIGEIRHIGLINAMELVTDKDKKIGFDGDLRIGYEIYKKALTHGLLLRPLGNVIYFNPPLNIENKDLDKAITLAKQSMDEVLK